jgi:hypothetical protein
VSFASISITELQVFTALRALIQSLIDPSLCEVIRTQGNRVPTPKGAFIALTPSLLERLSTNESTYNGTLQTQALKQSTKVSIHVDCYGPSSGEWAVTLMTVLRSEYASQFFDTQRAAGGIDMQTLYASEPQQLPLVTGESQFLERWFFESVLQTNPIVTLPQQSAIVVGPVKLINADVSYLPLQ